MTSSAPAAMPYTRSVTCSLRADASVSSPRISANSMAMADTKVKAQRWWRKANSVDMTRASHHGGGLGKAATRQRMVIEGGGLRCANFALCELLLRPIPPGEL